MELFSPVLVILQEDAKQETSRLHGDRCKAGSAERLEWVRTRWVGVS